MSNGQRYVSGVLRVPPDLPLALMDVAIGLLHLLSPPSRASSPAFTVTRTLTNTHAGTWVGRTWFGPDVNLRSLTACELL